MKKSLLLIFCLLMNELTYNVEKLKPHPRIKPEMTFTAVYLMATTLFSLYFIWPWFLDLDQFESCNIYCDQCDFKLHVLESYGYFAAAGNSKIISHLKRLFYQADVDKINQYLLKINIEEERECVVCRDYCGWHIL